MKILFFIMLFVSFFTGIYGQEGIPVYQDYLTGSWYLIHPSSAGAASTEQVRLTARTQWLDVDDAPSLYTASLNARVTKNIGVGGIAFSDTNGNFSQNGFYATFAYHINLNARAYELNQLSFGISAGILQRKLDESSLFNPRINDPAISGEVLDDTYINSDFGISYFKGDLFAFVTLKNALPVRRDGLAFETGIEPDIQRTFITTLGYIFSINREFDLEPSIMYINIPDIEEQLADINIKGYYKFNENSNLFGGASYRLNFDGAETTPNNQNVDIQRFGAISPFFGIDYKDFVFAYTYTNQIDEIKISSSGFHQITLGYNFKGKRNLRGGLRECNCPAFK